MLFTFYVLFFNHLKKTRRTISNRYVISGMDKRLGHGVITIFIYTSRKRINPTKAANARYFK